MTPIPCSVQLTPADKLLPLMDELISDAGTRSEAYRRRMTGRQYFRHIDADEPAVYLAAFSREDDEQASTPRPLGFARLVPRTHMAGGHALPRDLGCVELDEVYVAPQARGRGVLRALLWHVREYCCNHDMPFIYCRCTQPHLQRLWLRYGLHPMGMFYGDWRHTNLERPL